MPYVLELSGVVSYTDDSKSSFLAVDDTNGNVLIEDKQAFLDVGDKFRNLLAKNGGDLAIPTNLPKSGKKIRESSVSTRVVYTVDSQTHEFTLTSNPANGSISTGNGNLKDFFEYYKSEANKAFEDAWQGGTAYGKSFGSRLLFTWTNSSDYDGPLAVGVYLDKNSTPTLHQEFTIKNQTAFLFDFNLQSSFFIHVRRAGIDPAPTGGEINTEIGLLGLSSGELNIVGDDPNFVVSLKNIVFA